MNFYLSILYMVVLLFISVVSFRLGFNVGIAFLSIGLVLFGAWWIFVGRNNL